MDNADQIKSRSLRQVAPYQCRAQALIELVVFGGILIFILAAIATQGVGSTIESSRNSQLMRKALLASWNGGPGNMSPSFLMIEDRIALGVSKYGEIDRQPFIFSASGMLTKWMYYGASQSQRITLFLNGKSISLPASEEKETTLNADGTMGDSSVTPESRARFQREGGHFYAIESNFKDNEKYCHEDDIGVKSGCSFEDMKKRLNLKREAGFNLGSPEEARRLARTLSWQWRVETADNVYIEFKENSKFLPLYDIDGDLLLETIFLMKKEGGQYLISSVAESGAGDDPNCAPGLLPGMSIYTKSGDTYLKIDESVSGSGAGNTTRRVNSKSSKAQVDLIERQYRVGRGVKRIGSAVSCHSIDAARSCSARLPESQLCCYQGGLRDKMCLDTTSGILYLRSTLVHHRKTFWKSQKALR